MTAQTRAQAQDHAEVEALIHRLWEGWMTQDPSKGKSLWDKDYPNPTFLPTESHTRLPDLAAIEAYYDRVVPIYGGKSYEIVDLVIDFPTPDVAYALAFVHSDYTLIGVPEEQLVPFHTSGRCQVRNSFVMRRTDEGWKLLHFQESIMEYLRSDELKAYHQPYIQTAIDALQTIGGKLTSLPGNLPPAHEQASPE